MLLIKIIKNFSGGLRPFKLDVNFTIPSGIRHAVFFGPSGSGKTLTMQCVAGLARPDAGRIVVGDDVFFDSEQKICLHPQKRSVGYMPQDYALFPHLNILQNVAYSRTGLFGRRVSALEKARALEIMERFGLGGLGKHLPREISGGQKQRASLARAINSSPRLLLLDEPFSALDPLLREQARQEALGFIRNFDIPAIIITHDPADVDAFAGLLVLYKNGHAKTVENYQYLRATFDNAADCLRHLESMFPENVANSNP